MAKAPTKAKQEGPNDLLWFENKHKKPLAILRECVIQPGEKGEITRGATRNPGVKSWIDEEWLVAVGTAKQEEG